MIDADAASLGSRNAHGIWSPSPAGVQELRRLAPAHGPALEDPRGAHPLGRPACAVRARRRRRPTDRGPGRVPAGAPGEVSGLQGRRGGARGAIRSAPSAASSSACSGRSASRSSSPTPTRTRSRARSWARAASRRRTTRCSTRASCRRRSPSTRSARSPARSACRPRSSRRPCSSRSTSPLQKAAQKALLYGMQQARDNGNSPTGGSAVAIDPWTGAIKAIVSYPTFNEKAAAEKPGYLARLYKDKTTTPTLNRAIGGVYPTGSTFKPIIAEAALSAGIITPYTPQALHRLVHPRQPHLLQRRARCRRNDDPAHGARAVVRHVVLPARREDLGYGSGEEGDAHPELGAQARARHAAAGRPDRGRGRLPPDAREVLRAPRRHARTRRARRSTSRSARGRSRSARSSSQSPTRL